jgi:integrase/recombinase XerD
MAQASVLTGAEIRRVFRIIETTRHADRNRLAFVLSLYAGLRVGEIAALTIGDVWTQQNEVRREIKLDPHQTKGSRGRTVVLSARVRGEIGEYLKVLRVQRFDTPVISSQRKGSRILQRNSFDAVQGNIRTGWSSNLLALWKANVCDPTER